MATKKKAEKAEPAKKKPAKKKPAKKDAEASASKKPAAKKAAEASVSKKPAKSESAAEASASKKPAKSAAAEQSVSKKAVAAPHPAEQSVSKKAVAAPHPAEQSVSKKPVPPEPPVVKKPAPSAPPTWQTRTIEQTAMPRAAVRELEATYKLNWPAKLPDGSVIGLERGKLSESSVVRLAPDGSRVAVSKPGQFSSVAVTPDGKTVFGVSGDGKVWSFPTSGDASAATVVFEGKRVWGVTPIDASRAVVSEDGTVALMRTTETPWRELDEVSVKPITIPLVDAVDEGRWIIVGRSPKIHLFAVLEAQLLPVQSWVQVEAGVSAVDGRAFLYTAGSFAREELLNLTEVHRSL